MLPNTTIVVMNLPERTDRLAEFAGEMDKAGWQWERFEAIRQTPGWKGYNLSIAAVFEKYWDVPYLLLMEDDAALADDLTPFYEALEELPDGWDALWLGSNLQSRHRTKAGKSLYRLENGWNTHGVLMSRAFREYCTANWTPDGIVFDEWLRTVAQQQRNCYVVAPMVAIQRPSFSDIENKYADYTTAWETAKSRLL